MAPTNQEEFHEFQNPSAASIDRLITALDRAYHNPGRLMWRSFLGGLMYAFGATIGFTLVLTMSVYILQSLGGVSLLKPAVDKLQEMIIARQQQTITTENQDTINTLLKQYTSPTPKP